MRGAEDEDEDEDEAVGRLATAAELRARVGATA